MKPIGGKNRGYEGRVLVTSTGNGNGTVTPGQAINVNLADVQVQVEDKLGCGVQGFLCVLPTSTWNIQANTYVDAVSLCQLIQTISLSTADDSPPSAWDSGHQLINGVDFYRAATALSWLSGRSIFPSLGGRLFDFNAAAAADTLTMGAVAPFKGTMEVGWPWLCGPYGAADGTAANFSDRVMIYIPIGERHDEELDNTIIPASWFAGRWGGKSCSSAPGNLVFNLSGSVDGQAVTWGTEGIDVYTVNKTYPCEETPYPATPCIRTYQNTSSTGWTRKGVHKLWAFMKALTSGGAMQSHSYSQVDIQSEGQSIVNTSVGLQEAIAFLGVGNAAARQFMQLDFPRRNQVLSFRGATRNTRAMIPMLAHFGKETESPGAVGSELYYNVSQSGETQHNILDVTLTPITADGQAAAAKFADIQGGQYVMKVSSASGGIINPQQPVAAVLPQKVVDTSKAGG